jgi:hypothetical protein
MATLWGFKAYLFLRDTFCFKNEQRALPEEVRTYARFGNRAVLCGHGRCKETRQIAQNLYNCRIVFVLVYGNKVLFEYVFYLLAYAEFWILRGRELHGFSCAWVSAPSCTTLGYFEDSQTSKSNIFSLFKARDNGLNGALEGLSGFIF